MRSRTNKAAVAVAAATAADVVVENVGSDSLRKNLKKKNSLTGSARSKQHNTDPSVATPKKSRSDTTSVTNSQITAKKRSANSISLQSAGLDKKRRRAELKKKKRQLIEEAAENMATQHEHEEDESGSQNDEQDACIRVKFAVPESKSSSGHARRRNIAEKPVANRGSIRHGRMYKSCTTTAAAAAAADDDDEGVITISSSSLASESDEDDADGVEKGSLKSPQHRWKSSVPDKEEEEEDSRGVAGDKYKDVADDSDVNSGKNAEDIENDGEHATQRPMNYDDNETTDQAIEVDDGGTANHIDSHGDSNSDADMQEQDMGRKKKKNKKDKPYMNSFEDRREYSEGVFEIVDEYGSDVDGEFDPLFEVVTAMKKRRKSAQADDREVNPVRGPIRNLDGHVNLKDNWLAYYENKDRKFFTSDQAKMLEPGKTVRLHSGQLRASAYQGANVHENNSYDLRFCWEHEFGNRLNQSYINFRTFLGQVVRCAIALNRVDAEVVWDRGELFRIADNLTLWTVIMGYFQEKSMGGTVKHKAQMAGKFIDAARDYFSRFPLYGMDQLKNDRMDRKMLAVLRFIRKEARLSVAKAKRLKAFSKEDDSRTERGEFLAQEDISELRNIAASHLNGIMNTFHRRFEDRSAQDRKQRYETFQHMVNPGLLSKWMLNFTALLILYGSGQRNQVFTFLKYPTLSELDMFREEEGGAKAKTPLRLHISGFEKRPRDARLPFLMYNPIVFPMVHFHVEFIIPYLHATKEVNVRSRAAKLLLLDTRPLRFRLSSDSIRNTIKKFAKRVDFELHVTPMRLRAAHATYSMRRFIQRKEEGNRFLMNLTEDQFISYLAGVMNTGVKQIREVYASAMHMDYANHIAKVCEIVDTHLSSDADRSDGDELELEDESDDNEELTAETHPRSIKVRTPEVNKKPLKNNVQMHSSRKRSRSNSFEDDMNTEIEDRVSSRKASTRKRAQKKRRTKHPVMSELEFGEE